jgi:hypothetical protein
MKILKVLFAVPLVLLLASSVSMAADFIWFDDFNSTAEADPPAFKARLAARFQIGEAKINSVLSNVEKPADAYMVLRLGEMSKQPMERVIKEYRSCKGKGWGVIAKNLGIKPGSKEFHALKRGHDLYDDYDKGKRKGKGKGKGRD